MPRRSLTLFVALLMACACLAACSVNIGTKPAPTPAPAPAAQPTRTERVTIQGLNLRRGPSSKSAVIDGLEKDEVVTIFERQGNWIKVRTADGREGFAYGAYLTGFDIRPAKPRTGKGPAASGGPGASDALTEEEEQELWD
ncbi:SH3 domain-containing protein [Desulfolutivibrio sp.]|uniref:SH3 domain-containing protein n=1 Tax=Desulfolutivibrio sp. TaxID=2773296 RepID=UPI002F96AC83